MTIAKILQTLVDGQIKLQEGQTKLTHDINDLRQEMHQNFKEVRLDITDVNKKIDVFETRLTTRIDKIGHQVAVLDDDAPTREEHEKLVKEFKKVEKKVALF